MPDATTARTADLAALIERIVEDFHERHRRDLPVLVGLARGLGPPGAVLAAHLVGMGQALERHMFKEEMRLFPMIEQGGHTLADHLIDDLLREHREHEQAMRTLEALVSEMGSSPLPTPGLAADAEALRAGVGRLVDDLAEHVRLEDEVLFAGSRRR